MEFLEVLRLLVAVGGVYLLGRAARRRLWPAAGQRAPDPQMTRGLKVLALCALLLLLALALVTVGYWLGWDRRIAWIALGLMSVAAVVAFPLAAWLGWRGMQEELKPPQK